MIWSVWFRVGSVGFRFNIGALIITYTIQGVPYFQYSIMGTKTLFNTILIRPYSRPEPVNLAPQRLKTHGSGPVVSKAKVHHDGFQQKAFPCCSILDTLGLGGLQCGFTRNTSRTTYIHYSDLIVIIVSP